MSTLYDALSDAVSPDRRNLLPTLHKFETSAPDIFYRVIPVKTLSISLSEQACEQNCAHCNGHYLKGMKSLSQILSMNLDDYDSILVSGGSNSKGEVCFRPFIQDILMIPERIRLNLHPGFQSPQNLQVLAQRNPLVSFDLPADDHVIKNVFGLQWSVSDYRNLFRSYLDFFDTIPHLTIGLNPHSNAGELETLDFLASLRPRQLVLIGFRPTPGTRMQSQSPPELSRFSETLKFAIKRVKCPILLGCMRPSGIYRTDLDILAWMHGIKKIVQPDHKLLKILSESRINIIKQHNCCAFTE